MEEATKLGPPKEIKKISDVIWELPASFKKGMRVPARIIASEKLIKEMDTGVFDQISNVATLPGIVNYAYCMPDGHWGYGFPIGGVAAFDVENEGVISPGGIGFDINCGMRLVKTNLTYKEVQPKLKELTDNLFRRVPAGVGSEGFVKLNKQEFKTVIEDGAKWCVKNNYGWEEDLEFTEAEGCMKDSDSNKVSNKAIERGIKQIGTLGSGNHYLEIQRVKDENIFDKNLAKKLGLFDDQIVIMFHCGSRGFGHQVATDYLRVFLDVMEKKYKIKILDRELACAPFNSPEGQDYFAAMKCGINMSFANRQVILYRIREVFSKIFNQSPESLEMHQIYDVAHNTAKLEEHKIDGKIKTLLVHRKGSTRSFPPGHKELPKKYQEIGQPVILGGSMETGSYLLSGMKEGSSTFYSTAHGSGRTMSRMKAKKIWNGQTLQKDMEKHGIYVRTTSFSGLAEEAGGAYKSVDEVCETAEKAGISRRIVKLVPLGNVKG